MPALLSRAQVLSFAAYASATAALPALGQAPATLRVGVESGAETFAELMYGVESGIFSRNHLDVEPTSFTAAGPIAAALAGGSLDIGTIDLIVLANAVNRGIPLVAIAGSGLFRAKGPTSGLCVGSNSLIRNAKNLEGSTVAVGTLVSLTSISLRMWLAQNGANPAQVQFAEMKFAEMPAALGRGTVAAAYMTEPLLTQYADQIRLIATPYAAIAETFPISVIATTRSWLAQNATTAHKFVAATYDTARWANSNQGQTAAILAKYTKLDVGIIRRMQRTTYATGLDLTAIQAVLNAASNNKLIDRPTNAGDLTSRLDV